MTAPDSALALFDGECLLCGGGPLGSFIAGIVTSNSGSFRYGRLPAGSWPLILASTRKIPKPLRR